MAPAHAHDHPGARMKDCMVRRFGQYVALFVPRKLFRFQVQTAFPGDGTAACAYYIGEACTQKRKNPYA